MAPILTRTSMVGVPGRVGRTPPVGGGDSRNRPTAPNRLTTPAHLLEHEIVVAAAQAAVARHHHQQHAAHRAHAACGAVAPVAAVGAQALLHAEQHLCAGKRWKQGNRGEGGGLI
eukprot:362321-Chlamydomonas_euryale.AAC.11